MHVNFISPKDTGETRTINVLSDNEEIMLGYETDDNIINLFESFLNNYQKQEQIMRGGSDFVLESVELLDYKLHDIKFKRRGSYIKSPKWIRDKAATVNPKNKGDNNCLQYAVPATLDHQNIGSDPQIISKIKPFFDKYNWKGIDFPVHQNNQEESQRSRKNNMGTDREKFEQNNKTNALNIFFVLHNKEKIKRTYISKYNHKRKNQVVFLTITDVKKWHYLALKSIPAAADYNRPIRSLSILFRGITSNHNGDFYCMGCLHSFLTDNTLKKHDRLCGNHDYCHIVMPKQDEKY